MTRQASRRTRLPSPSDRFQSTDGQLVSLSSPREVQGLVDALARGPLEDDERLYLRKIARASFGAAARRE